jgi:hypothetical protein
MKAWKSHSNTYGHDLEKQLDDNSVFNSYSSHPPPPKMSFSAIPTKPVA